MCPSCGAPPGRVSQNGYDDHDRVLRLRVCQTCDAKYTTVELPVPGSFYKLADSWRHKQVLRARMARGYHNTRSGRHRRPRPVLIVDVKYIPERAA
jgi:transcriptional regulator NrdR family protein